MSDSHHKPYKSLSYITGDINKLYEDLDNWFTTISTDGKIFQVYAPVHTKGYGSGYGQLMGGMSAGGILLGHIMKKPSLWYTTSDGGRQHVDWDFKDKDGAVKYIWLMTQKQKDVSEEVKLREFIQEVLTEEHFLKPEHIVSLAGRHSREDIRIYKDIDGWIVANASKVVSAKFIYKPHPDNPKLVVIMGLMFNDGHMIYIDGNGKEKRIPWKFTDEKNAVRFVYMQSQIPNTLNEAHYQPTIANSIHSSIKKNVYKDLDEWFTTDTSWGKQIYQPWPTKGKSELAYNMGSLSKPIPAAQTAEYTQVKDKPAHLGYYDSNGKQHQIEWDYNDVKGAVQFVYLQSQIPTQLNEGVVKIDTIDIPDLPGWIATRLHNESSDIKWWSIMRHEGNRNDFKENGYMGTIKDNGELSFGSGSAKLGSFKKEIRKDLINDPIQTARYIWLLLQNPKPLNEGRMKEDIEIEGMPGWRAQRYDETATGGNAWWSISNKGQYMGAIFDSGLLNVTRNIRHPQEQRPDLVGNPIQTARYMYLVMQPKK